LTKPDRIPTGEETNWLPFIRNEKEPLVNNWFCVKQPSSNDLKSNLTWDQARKREDTFFSSTAPWSELDSVYQKYLRTGNLVDRLSSILSDLISKRSFFITSGVLLILTYVTHFVDYLRSTKNSKRTLLLLVMTWLRCHLRHLKIHTRRYPLLFTPS